MRVEELVEHESDYCTKFKNQHVQSQLLFECGTLRINMFNPNFCPNVEL